MKTGSAANSAIDQRLATEEEQAPADDTGWTQHRGTVRLPGRRTVEAKELRAPVVTHLLTPAGLQAALEVFGLLWQPQWLDDLDGEERQKYRKPALYCWVVPSETGDHLHSPILYLGIGESETDGCIRRLQDEASWREGVHGHGRMQKRLGARPVVGVVTPGRVDLSWASEVLARDYNAEYGRAKIEAFLNRKETLRAAEALAIRLAIAFGDTGAPVNSAGAGAWNTDHGADWAAVALEAFVAAQHDESRRARPRGVDAGKETGARLST